MGPAGFGGDQGRDPGWQRGEGGGRGAAAPGARGGREHARPREGGVRDAGAWRESPTGAALRPARFAGDRAGRAAASGLLVAPWRAWRLADLGHVTWDNSWASPGLRLPRVRLPIGRM